MTKNTTRMRCGAGKNGTTMGTTGLITTEMSGSAMATEDHDHSEYVTSSGVICENCGEVEDVCAMCGEPLHKCAMRLPKGFRQSTSFPDYMVNNQGTVKSISTGRPCLFMRISATGGSMIKLYKDGKPYIRAAQTLRDEMFTEPKHVSIMCGTCNHHPDAHLYDQDECLSNGCHCKRYVKRGL